MFQLAQQLPHLPISQPEQIWLITIFGLMVAVAIATVIRYWFVFAKTTFGTVFSQIAMATVGYGLIILAFGLCAVEMFLFFN